MANTSKRGFASMDNEKQRTIASKGGRAAHVKGTAHEWSSEEARAAGRKGGESRGSRNKLNDTLNASAPQTTNNSFGTPSYSSENNWVAEAGSSLRNSNSVSNPIPSEFIAPGIHTGSLANARVN